MEESLEDFWRNSWINPLLDIWRNISMDSYSSLRMRNSWENPCRKSIWIRWMNFWSIPSGRILKESWAWTWAILKESWVKISIEILGRIHDRIPRYLWRNSYRDLWRNSCKNQWFDFGRILGENYEGNLGGAFYMESLE